MAELKQDRSFDEVVDPAVEDAYWSDRYRTRIYVKAGAAFSDYRHAYRYGWESRAKTRANWEDVSDDLARGRDKAKAKAHLAWEDAKDAVRDGEHRIERVLPGDADRDGR